MTRFLGVIIALLTGILITMPSFRVCEHGDANADHNCDYCFEALSECEDPEIDHICNYCGGDVGVCEDKNFDHVCDYGCGRSVGDHIDVDMNHSCD